MSDLPTPETREETFLASAAGESVTVPTPVTREEQYLAAIASGGGGGSGGGGVLVVNVTAADDTSTCDKTAGEMAAAYLSGGVVIAVPAEEPGYNDNYFLVVSADWGADGYYRFRTADALEYSAGNASEYPVIGGM